MSSCESLSLLLILTLRRGEWNVGQSSQGRVWDTIKCGWFSESCELYVKWPPDVHLRGPLKFEVCC